MTDQTTINSLRFLAYAAGVLKAQQEADSRCRVCKSLAGTARKLRAALEGFDGHGPAGEEAALLRAARERMEGLRIPSDPVPQRKVGNCAFADKACMVLHAAGFMDIG